MRRSLIACCFLLVASLVPAHAQTTRLAAPFDCGSDELARRGALIVNDAIPRAASQGVSCGTTKGVVLWSWFTPTTSVPITVRIAQWQGIGAPCLFVRAGTTIKQVCAIDPVVDADVTAGTRYAIGVSVADPDVVSVVSAIEVTQG